MTGRPYPDITYERCTHEVLAELSMRHGVDFATRFFHDRIRSAPQNRDLVAALDGRNDGSDDENFLTCGEAIHSHIRGTILIAPALFYRERPDIGGDGAVIQHVARAAGLRVAVLPVASAGTARTNADTIRTLLPEYCADPTVLVSLSKGAADVRLAFETMTALPPALKAWVIVSGLVHGSPAIDRLTGRWWSRWTLRALLARHGAPFALAEEFTARGSSPLNRRAKAPRGLLVINLIGCPLSRDLGTRFGRIRHRQMAPLGPNDGLGLLRDAIVEPGLVYPVWGADHYFRTNAVPRVISRLIAFLSAKGCFSLERT
jgi:hypothetical protein